MPPKKADSPRLTHTCRHCGAGILLGRTRDGQPVALDLESDRYTWVVVADTEQVVVTRSRAFVDHSLRCTASRRS